jgi:hypothetical protein
MTAAELIAALPSLPDSDLEAILEAARKERERRATEARPEASLADELDALAATLAERLERLSAAEMTAVPASLPLSLVVTVPGGRYPVVGVAGYRASWRCEESLYCGADAAACWPETLGVKPWDWPWQPLDPLTRKGGAVYARGFVLSFAPVERAGAVFAVHAEPKYVPHKCLRAGPREEEHPRSRSAYFRIGTSPEGLAVAQISWAAYRALCSRAAEALPELRQAQEKSRREAEAFAAKKRR